MKMKKTTGEWRKIGQVLYAEPDCDDDFYYTLTTSYLSFKADLSDYGTRLKNAEPEILK